MKTDDKRAGWIGLAAAVLVCAYLLQVWCGMLNKSATYDEQVYVLAGYTYLDTGVYSLKQDAPPLIPLLAGVSLKAYDRWVKEIRLAPEIVDELPRIKALWADGDFESTKEYDLANQFFADNNSLRIMQVARLPIGMLGAFLCIIFFLYARLLFGDKIGLLGLLLFVCDPNLVGHARVVSADLGLAAFFLAAHYFHLRCLMDHSKKHLIALALVVGFCVCTKLSGLLVLISLFLMTVFVLILPPKALMEPGELNKNFRTRNFRLAMFAVPCLVFACYLMLSLVYLDWKAPSIFYQATKLIYTNVPEKYESYLWGEYQTKFWHYYPVAVILKSTVALVVLSIGGVVFFKSKREFSRTLLFVPLIVIFLVSSFDAINIGLRRVLLAIPFLHLLSTGFIFYAWKSVSTWMCWPSRGLVLAGTAWTLFVAFTVFPNHLSFFSAAVGGSSQGYRYLAESNLSWGQNLPALKSYLDEQAIERVVFHYYGGDDPACYGIEREKFNVYHLYWPIQKVYVMSAHSLIQFRKNKDEGSDWFERFEPDSVVEDTLFVYDLRKHGQTKNRTPEASLRLARSLVLKNKLGNSVIHFQAYLADAPGDKSVHLELAKVALKLGHRDLADFHLGLGVDSSGWFFDDGASHVN